MMAMPSFLSFVGEFEIGESGMSFAKVDIVSVSRELSSKSKKSALTFKIQNPKIPPRPSKTRKNQTTNNSKITNKRKITLAQDSSLTEPQEPQRRGSERKEREEGMKSGGAISQEFPPLGPLASGRHLQKPTFQSEKLDNE
jgi:hypothetical protein